MPASFRNLSGSQRRRLPCLKLIFRDVLSSLLGGCGLWLPLKPKLLCGVALLGTRRRWPFTHAYALERLAGFMPIATHATYATIIVKRLTPITSRATPPHRQNQPDVALFTSDRESETRNYKGQGLNCQGADPLKRWYPALQFLMKTLEKPLHQIPDPHTNSSQ